MRNKSRSGMAFIIFLALVQWFICPWVAAICTDSAKYKREHAAKLIQVKP